MTSPAPPVKGNPIQLGHGSELGVRWARNQPGYVLLNLPNGDTPLCVAADAGASVLRLGEKRDGTWHVWARVDTAAVTGGDALALRLTLTEQRLELRLEQTVLFSMDRPASLSQPLYLSCQGAFSEPTLGLNAARAAALDAVVRADIADAGLGATAQPDLIYDIGLHVGQDTDFYLKKGFRVVAVEANPMLARMGAERFGAAIAAGRLTLLNVGLGQFAGQFPFYVNRVHSEWSSFDPKVASRGHPIEEVMVPMVTIGQILDAYGVPYLMKIDIEAYDRFAVQGLAGRSRVPPLLSIENGPMAQFELIAKLGYRRFKLVEQSALRGTKAPIPALEGETVEHVFPPGSSGPFGAETAGAWLDVDAMRTALAAHHARPIPAGQWFDLHAARE